MGTIRPAKPDPEGFFPRRRVSGSVQARAAYEAERRRAAEARAAYEAEIRKEAEVRAAREAEARRSAEAEIARLKEELDRLRRTGD